MAASRLDDASLVLLAFAYLTGALALLTGAAPLFARSLAVEWKIFGALAGVLAGAVLFVTLKYASESLRALADVARAAARVEERLDRSLSEPRQASAAPPLTSREAAP